MRSFGTALIATLFLLLPAASHAAQTAQQQKMKDCNAEATQKGVSGADRQAFMKTCLSSGHSQPVNSQQQKMKSCNSEASAKKLTGDARKQFMSTCLKGS